MKHFNRLFASALFLLLAMSMPSGLEAAKKYCDAAIIGILQGNPAKVAVKESDFIDEYETTYEFSSDGALTLYRSMKPYDIVRDNQGRLKQFKTKRFSVITSYEILWDKEHPNEVLELISIDSTTDPNTKMPLSDTGTRYKYSQRPNSKDRYVSSYSTYSDLLDVNGNVKNRLITDGYSFDEWKDVRFDNKGNVIYSNINNDDGDIIKHQRQITYHP